MTMKLPLLSELDKEQLDIYGFPADQSLVVIGPPGSGKTSMAIWRAMFAARQEQKVVLITKGRMLKAMAGQLGREGAEGDGKAAFTTTTMQKFVWSDCVDNAGRRPNGGEGDYTLDWRMISGWYEAKVVSPHVDHMIIDEGQNLPFGFLAWAHKYVAKTISIFADEHQTTVDDGTTMQELRTLGIRDWKWLAYNHRNTPEIARVAAWFHRDRQLPESIVRRPAKGDVPKVVRVGSWDDLADKAANRLVNTASSIGVITYEQVDVEAIYKAMRKAVPKEKRVDWFHSKRPAGAEFFPIRDEGITVHSSESAIGLEFDTVYLQDLERSLKHPGPESDRRLYMLTARARDLLVLVNGEKELDAAQLERLPPKPIVDR